MSCQQHCSESGSVEKNTEWRKGWRSTQKKLVAWILAEMVAIIMYVTPVGVPPCGDVRGGRHDGGDVVGADTLVVGATVCCFTGKLRGGGHATW